MNKIQTMEVMENTGAKDANGKAVRVKVGDLYMESCQGRLDEIIMEHGREFVEKCVDQQLLYHNGAAAFKAKGSKSDPTTGLDRLKRFPEAANVLYRSTVAEAEKEGFDVTSIPEGATIVMINWGFKPGTSQAALAKETAIQKAIALQLELLGGEVSDELRAKVETLVRSRM
jgi:hypothetical protein